MILLSFVCFLTICSIVCLCTGISIFKRMLDLVNDMSHHCVITTLIFGLMLCSEIQCRSECNHWYDQVPKSANNTVCNITEGAMVSLTCAIYHPCNNINYVVKWYKSSAEINAGDNIIRNSGEYINPDDNEYSTIFINRRGIAHNSTFEQCCFTSVLLSINDFSHGDNAYYWCQIVADNRVLLPSPYGYISLSRDTASNNHMHACTVGDLISHLHPAVCADNTTLRQPYRMTCNSQSTTTAVTVNSESTRPRPVTVTEAVSTHSESTLPHNSDADAETSPINSESSSYPLRTAEESSMTNTVPINHTTQSSTTNSREEIGNSQLYGAIAGAFICFAVVLVLVVVCLAILFYKYRKLEKKAAGDHKRNNRFMMDTVTSGEIRNKHYIKTVLTTDPEHKDEHTKLFTMYEQEEHEKDNSIGSEKNVTDDVNDGHDEHFVNLKTESMSSPSQEPPQYAVVNKDLKKTKLVKNKQPILPPYTEKPEDSTLIRKAETLQKQNYFSPRRTLERSPSPVYAEVSNDTNEQQPQPFSFEVFLKKQGDLAVSGERSSSPEYAAVDDVNRQSKDFTIESKEEEEQHYNHSLEDPIGSSNVSENKISSTKGQGGSEFKDSITKCTGEEQHYYYSLEAQTDGNATTKGQVSPKSKDYTSKSTGAEEQHCYHSLESPIDGQIVGGKRRISGITRWESGSNV